MRIVSLVPSATEMLFALGAGDEVVGVTHECDFPLDALDLPKVTLDKLPPGLDAREIDEAVRAHTEQGEAIYELDAARLRELQPDLIATQALCAVCAVSADDVRAVAKDIESQPEVISLDPSTIGEVMGDIRILAKAIGRVKEGDDLIEDCAARTDAIRLAVRGASRPRVAALEWLDPVFVAGHWVPQLIDYAGGEDVLGLPGERSEVFDWELVKAAQPDIVVVMPCGYDAERSQEEAYTYGDELEELGARLVVAVDAAGLFSRPSHRLIEGLETLAHILHADRVPEAPSPPLEVAL
jgi:iron complex transport system substrate-binding protein